MEPNVSSQIDVKASPERIYELVSDLDSLATVAAELHRHRWLDGETSARVGARFQGDNKRGILRWSTVATVTDAEPGKRFAFDVAAGPIQIARWQYEIEPTADGARVTESMWDKRNVWAKQLGRIVTAVWDRDALNKQHIESTLRSLKEHAER